MDYMASTYLSSDEPVDIVNLDLIRLWLARACRMPSVASWFDGMEPITEKKRQAIMTVRHQLGLNETSGRADIGSIIDELSLRNDLEQGVLFRNLRLLARRIGLTAAEQHILAFRVLVRLSNSLAAMMVGLLNGWNDMALQKRLSIILGISETLIEKALSSEGTLRSSRLLITANTLEDALLEKTGLSPGLINTLSRPHKTVGSLLSFLLEPSCPGNLKIDHFPHLEQEIAVTMSYLKTSAATRRKGVNLLLYGPPGTGKTELVKAICQALGWKLYDVLTKNKEGNIANGSARIDGLVMAQRVLQRARNTAILFDEIEDAIDQPIKQNREPIQIKPFLNEFLGEVAVPTFWITNHPQRVDPAFMRRFDIVINVGEPPQSVKRRILVDACQGIMLDDMRWIDRQAEVDGLTPALISRFADVARLATTSDANDFTNAFEMLRDQQFRAHGRKCPVTNSATLLDHDMAAINASLEPRALAERVAGVGSARLLFHGVPGSGKSAYAQALACAIDRPLLARQASDLLSPYIGETEHNIRRAFERARSDRALLLIDEVDSFLQTREKAVRSWEVTQVNEFLTQLEQFDGIVVCTTNYIDNLDGAAMRRFDAKVEFKPLKLEQACRLFRQLCDKLGLAGNPLDNRITDRLSRIDTLTPGDFATVARLMRLTEPQKPEDLVAALLEEQRHKPAFRNHPMGFMA